MVFKTNDQVVSFDLCSIIQSDKSIAFEHVIADHSLFMTLGIKIYESHEIQLFSVPCPVILPHYLISAADTKKYLLIIYSSSYIRLFVLVSIFKQCILLKILTAADEK